MIKNANKKKSLLGHVSHLLDTETKLIHSDWVAECGDDIKHDFQVADVVKSYTICLPKQVYYPDKLPT